MHTWISANIWLFSFKCGVLLSSLSVFDSNTYLTFLSACHLTKCGYYFRRLPVFHYTNYLLTHLSVFSVGLVKTFGIIMKSDFSVCLFNHRQTDTLKNLENSDEMFNWFMCASVSLGGQKSMCNVGSLAGKMHFDFSKTPILPAPCSFLFNCDCVCLIRLGVNPFY